MRNSDVEDQELLMPTFPNEGPELATGKFACNRFAWRPVLMGSVVAFLLVGGIGFVARDEQGLFSIGAVTHLFQKWSMDNVSINNGDNGNQQIGNGNVVLHGPTIGGNQQIGNGNVNGGLPPILAGSNFNPVAPIGSSTSLALGQTNSPKQDADVLVQFNNLVVPSRPYLLAICHSMGSNNVLKADNKQLITFTDPEMTLPVADALEALGEIQKDPTHVPQKVGMYDVKSAFGEFPGYPCQGDDDLPTMLLWVDPKQGSTRTVRSLKGSDCFTMEGLMQIMDNEKVDLMVMLACKASASTNIELGGARCAK